MNKQQFHIGDMVLTKYGDSDEVRAVSYCDDRDCYMYTIGNDHLVCESEIRGSILTLKDWKALNGLEKW